MARTPHSRVRPPRGILHVGLLWDPDVCGYFRRRPAAAATDLVILPELFDGGYALLRRGGGRHAADGALPRALRALTRERPVTLVAGSIALRGGSGKPTNTVLVFRSGRLLARYDKIHLFRPAGDTRFFRAGSRPVRFRLNAGGKSVTAGLAVCFDLRFPELFRALAVRGVRLFLVPARWPAARDDAWRTLLKARAIENQAFVVGCNARGREGGWSYVFSPRGELLYTDRGRRKAALARVALDLGEPERAARLFRTIPEAVLLRRTRRVRRRSAGAR